MLLLMLAATGCGSSNQKDAEMPARDIATVMNEHAERLMARPDVVMVAVGELPDKTPCIQVYLREINDINQKEIGATIEGHPVDFILSDEIRPMN